MKKYVLILFVAVATLVGCGKDGSESVPETSSLTGNKYRVEAYENSAGIQVYAVIEFLEGNKIEDSYRLATDSYVNPDYNGTATYEVLSDNTIKIDHTSGITDEKTTSEAFITGDIINIKEGGLKGAYKKY